MSSVREVKRKHVNLERNVLQKLELIEKSQQGVSVGVCEIYSIEKHTVSDIHKSKYTNCTLYTVLQIFQHLKR